MKVFNIRNSRKFFECIASCTGSVELVNEDGMHLTLKDGSDSPDMLPMYYMDGEIRRMELVFSDDEDCRRVFSYLTGARDTVA